MGGAKSCLAARSGTIIEARQGQPLSAAVLLIGSQSANCGSVGGLGWCGEVDGKGKGIGLGC